MNKRKTPVVILSTADFDAPVWTNKQHIASRLAGGREVFYINSLGLREPSVSRADLARMWGRARGRKHSRRTQVAESLHLLSPLVIPFHRFKVTRMVNRLLLARFRRKALPENYILWSFSPVTYGLEHGAAAVVYHSVDLLHTLPRMPVATMLKAEADLVMQRGISVIASSTGVAEHLASVGASAVEVWPNVADVDLFANAAGERRQEIAIFAGNLTPSKIDISLLEAVVAAGVQLHIAGPSGIDGTESGGELSDLLRHEQVKYLGVLTQEQLATEMGRCRVGLIPYQINAYTRGVFPMKVYEYAAAGLWVVSTPLPSLDNVDLEAIRVKTSDPAVFAGAVVDALALAAPRSNRLDDNSWSARLQQVENLLSALRGDDD